MNEPFHPHQHPRLAFYNEIAMISLALLGGAALLAREFLQTTPSQIIFYDRLDIGIALVFLTEFITKFSLAHDRLTFFRSYWWELLAAIPITTQLTQALRIVRVFRIVRVTRVLAHILTAQVNSKKAKEATQP
jgi:hypothetical protein